MSFMGQKDAEDPAISESLEQPESPRSSSAEKEGVENNELANSTIEQPAPAEEETKETIKVNEHPERLAGMGAVVPEEANDIVAHHVEVEADSQGAVELSEPTVGDVRGITGHLQQNESSEKGSTETSEPGEEESIVDRDQVEAKELLPLEQHNSTYLEKSTDIPNVQEEETAEEVSPVLVEDGSNDTQVVNETGPYVSQSTTSDMTESAEASHFSIVQRSNETSDMVPDGVGAE